MENLADALYAGLILLGYEAFNPNSVSCYHVILLNTDHILTINIKKSTYSTTLPDGKESKNIEKDSLAYVHTLMSNLQ